MANSRNDVVWQDKKRTLFGLPLSFTTYYLTPTKFISRKGFLSIEEDEIDLYKITDKKIILTFGQRLVGCGTIRLYSRDTDSPEKDIICIKKPREVSELLDQYITEHRDRYGIRGKDLIGGHHEHHDMHDYDDKD